MQAYFEASGPSDRWGFCLERPCLMIWKDGSVMGVGKRKMYREWRREEMRFGWTGWGLAGKWGSSNDGDQTTTRSCSFQPGISILSPFASIRQQLELEENKLSYYVMHTVNLHSVFIREIRAITSLVSGPWRVTPPLNYGEKICLPPKHHILPECVY